jgi:hypothetical protein
MVLRGGGLLGSNSPVVSVNRERGREIRGDDGADRWVPQGSERERGRRGAGLARAGLAGLGPGCGPVGLGHHPFSFFCSAFFLFLISVLVFEKAIQV